jgi:hypothetical protein
MLRVKFKWCEKKRKKRADCMRRVKFDIVIGSIVEGMASKALAFQGRA